MSVCIRERKSISRVAFSTSGTYPLCTFAGGRTFGNENYELIRQTNSRAFSRTQTYTTTTTGIDRIRYIIIILSLVVHHIQGDYFHSKPSNRRIVLLRRFYLYLYFFFLFRDPIHYRTVQWIIAFYSIYSDIQSTCFQSIHEQITRIIDARIKVLALTVSTACSKNLKLIDWNMCDCFNVTKWSDCIKKINKFIALLRSIVLKIQALRNFATRLIWTDWFSTFLSTK